MRNPAPNITVAVDLSNPGQFFACCGLLELADKLWPESVETPQAEGWFEAGQVPCTFQIAASPAANLSELLIYASRLDFDLGNDGGESDDEEDNGQLDPIVLKSSFGQLPQGQPRVRLVLDWWSDKSIKPWAGSMKERLILHAMLRAIDPSTSDPWNDAKVVFDPGKKKKREPFYFDCRRGCNSHPLDSGFSPDRQGMKAECFPAVEALCFIGLQRARPAPTDVPNRSRYTAWINPLPVNAIAPVVCGLAQMHGALAFTFDNFFRTDQRKHKSYSRATPERSD